MSNELSPEIQQWVTDCVDSIIGKVVDGNCMTIYGTCKPNNSAEYCITLNVIDQKGLVVDTEVYDVPTTIDLAQLAQISGRIITDVEERTGIEVNVRKVTITGLPQELLPE